MFISELIFSIVFALTIALFFSFGFKNRGPWGNIWVFFVVIFLGIWASSRWIEPFGPTYMGIAWMPLLLIGLLIALLLSAAVPIKSYKQKKREKHTHENPPSSEKIRLGALGFFFWTLVISLLLVIIIGYSIN